MHLVRRLVLQPSQRKGISLCRLLAKTFCSKFTKEYDGPYSRSCPQCPYKTCQPTAAKVSVQKCYRQKACHDPSTFQNLARSKFAVLTPRGTATAFCQCPLCNMDLLQSKAKRIVGQRACRPVDGLGLPGATSGAGWAQNAPVRRPFGYEQARGPSRTSVAAWPADSWPLH
eukprot:Skav221659  [mRNA]  locus=scaffold1750:188019:188531:+ [translate_table: standard]